MNNLNGLEEKLTIDIKGKTGNQSKLLSDCRSGLRMYRKYIDYLHNGGLMRPEEIVNESRNEVNVKKNILINETGEVYVTDCLAINAHKRKRH
jgi:hypothetical protein